MKYIPFKVKIYLPIEEDLRKVLIGNSVIILPCDSKKFTKPIREKIKTFYENSFNLPSEIFEQLRWEEIELENEGFEVSFVNIDRESRLYHYIDRMGSTLVKIEHPGLSRFKGINFVVVLENIKLLGLIKESGYMTDSKIHGTFCCRYDTSVVTFFGNTTLEIENPENSTLKSEKESGELLYKSRKTTKWLPGNIYILGNGSKILYIGDFDKNLDIIERISSRYNITKGAYLGSEVDNYNIEILNDKRESKYHLYINFGEFIEGLEKENIEQINSYKGSDLPFFLSFLTGFLETCKTEKLNTLMYYRSFPLGVRLESFLNCPSDDAKTDGIIKEFFRGLFNLKNGPGTAFAAWVDYNKLTDLEKEKYDKLYKNKLTRFYNSTSTPEKFYAEVVSSSTSLGKYRYSYYRICRNILYVIGKDRFLRYLR